MIYGRNYLTGLQSADRLQQSYCRPADRKYEGLTGWLGLDCKVRIFVVFAERHFPRSLLPHHGQRSQQFRDIASQYVIITQAGFPPENSSHYSSSELRLLTGDCPLLSSHPELVQHARDLSFTELNRRQCPAWSLLGGLRETPRRCHDWSWDWS